MIGQPGRSPTLEELKRTYREGYNIGVRLGEPSLVDDYYLHCVDVDVHDESRADEVENVLKSKFPGVRFERFPCVISGSGSGSFHLYIVTDKPYRSKKIAYSGEFVIGKDGKKHRAWEIEFFGTGKQVVLPPSIHPSGNPYRFEREFDYDALPKVKAHIIEALFEVNDGPRLEGKGEKLGFTPKEIRAAIYALPPEYVEDRQLWIETGMAIHNETDGSKAGLKSVDGVVEAVEQVRRQGGSGAVALVEGQHERADHHADGHGCPAQGRNA